MKSTHRFSKDLENDNTLSLGVLSIKDQVSSAPPTSASSSTSPPEKDTEPSHLSDDGGVLEEEKRVYVTGWKLFSLMFALRFTL